MANHGNDDYVYNNRFLGTLIITDNTGTPIPFTVEMYGDLTIEDGGYNVVRHRDENGDFAAYPPNRGQANETKWTIKAKQIGLPGQTAAVAITDDLTVGDYVHQSGEYTNLTSTLTGAGTRHEKTFTVALVITNGTRQTTYTLTRATIKGKFAVGEEANMYDLEITAAVPYTTLAEAAVP